MKKYITISIIGKTNVGKSSLFNKLNNRKFSIVTDKKNTTKQNIIKHKFLFNTDCLIIDTPGPIIRNKYNIYNVNKYIYDVIFRSSVLILILDKTKLESEDHFIMEIIKKFNIYKILLINKIDEIDNIINLKNFIQDLKFKNKFDEILPISIKKNINIKYFFELIKKINIIKKNIIENPYYIKYDLKNLCVEYIREVVLNNLNKELPYIININLLPDIITESTKVISIYFIIKKLSQKNIIIGKDGKKILEIKKFIKISLMKILKNLNTIYINFIIKK
jgi:GTPase